MRLMPGSPPPVLPVVLALTLAAFLPQLSSGATPFPQDLEPISVVGRESSYLYPSFQGLMSDNDTVRLGLDFQRMLRINHMLYIAARDHVFAVNLASSSEQIIPQQKLTWKTKDVEKCTVRGKNSDECYNYIKVLVPRNDETLFACGTNAFNPTCRNYKMATLEQEGEEVVGQARCPFESRQSNVGLFAGGDFYSATMTDFLASDAVIYRSLGESSPVLRTVKYDSKWLREPHFLHAIEYGNYVYFFFSEIAVEYTTLGKVVFSRVARVCKNDNGGSPRVLERYWTSFLKARLNCSVPGDSFFYFDVLQSLTNVLQINHRPAVLGVFTTQANSITGSAVCAFYMDDIEKAFSGKFKEQRNSESAWTPVPEEQVPKPRPGCCAGEGSAAAYKSSTTFPDETLTFIKSYPLMDESVPSVNDRPYFTRTTSRFKLTQIAVDTSAGPYKNHTVIFLGSDNGHVLKILASTEGANASFNTQVLEDIDVYNPNKCNVRGEDRRVLGLELDRDHHALFVAFSSCVIRVPLSRCSDYSSCKKSCLSSRDPYCIWIKSGTCATVLPGFKGGFEQDVENGYHQHPDTCHDVLATTRRQNTALDSAYGKTTPTSASTTFHGAAFPKEAGDPERGTGPDGPPSVGEQGSPDSEPISVEMEGVRRPPDLEKTNHSVHYTLLIACVLVAFVLGAFLSGFLVSCYCNHTGHKTKKLSKDPEAPIPHALSLRSLAKLNGLLDSQSKDDKLEVSSPKIYNSFFANSKEHHQPRRNGHHGMTMGDLVHQHHHHHLHHSSELSGLPTPDSTPELPIKSMKAFKNQWEKNQNCNNAKEPKSHNIGSRPSSALLHQQVFPYSHALSNGQPLVGGHLHPEERKIHNVERVLSQQPYPGYSQKVMEVTSLDELLKHIHDASSSKNSQLMSPSGLMASGGGGQLAFANRIQPQIPETESAPYYSSSTLPRDSLTRRMDVPPDIPPHHQSTLERRHSSQRHSLIAAATKMPNGSAGGGGGGGGMIPRQHSFSQRNGGSHQPPPLLARMNSTGSACEVHYPLIPNGYLARQHSYNGDQQEVQQRGAIIRRATSLKPDVPPKPLFIPATSPVNQQGKFNY
ncbi:sema domain, transmembrane domain (TM), and cytoplasmic domain, (semaphorin) 6E isoform X1 [Cheilinus undulatus]|uniref:sema domain, transmembrane domain (TM), and cytoplasmic domain, (semaphorin) 6E isoform X1 n=1 Tax=Cheilinus undulatus TaxID=241271 RepID=UPI001BD21C3A|nr:sema domain, transmembrane domain (TM), and cytoplasmic domain, (semaphorin) 6E isoform X1 [Cheilinus undulatus]XP_041649504.1 sema domain, transmembrane domain (TM), and cytoplasmic domain, (semaphorin) 6E isoform X1 [Cheilinus undulatus]XP_041649506.1 sema domain, transmembrane domain (TM), and cytoplasmic domain, (semaphorin) 6E isoform X1 [Cheilinus undulatus]XP_041649507.1 sema domain, transmembrane domain (TM), and cytoplasmic domain, (semaphorin) 6E isoform X1 [Cheilinus undulatus]XP_